MGTVIGQWATLKTLSFKVMGKTGTAATPRCTGYLLRIHGVDVIDIFGMRESSALEILAETGTDLSKWENKKNFVPWLNLCPNNKITGGKLISSTVLKKKAGLATMAFWAAANSVQKSNIGWGITSEERKPRAETNMPS